MGLEVRQIRDSDIESWHACLSGVVAERDYLAFAAPPTIESARAFACANIERGSPMVVALAPDAIGADAERVVGWCDVNPMGRDAMMHVGLLGIALAPEWRGRGLGEWLMRTAIDAAWDYGFEKIELGVRAHNQRAHALYDKLGFVEEGCRRRRIWIDGVFHDEILMALFRDREALIG